MQNKKYTFLDQINSPADLKEFDRENVGVLADEIRDFLIDNVSQCGGHLAPRPHATIFGSAMRITTG